MNSPMMPEGMRAMYENTNAQLKKLFEGKINGSFLIKIKSNIVEKLGKDIFKYYHLLLDDVSILCGIDDPMQYDICNLIIGTHKHHTIFLSKREIREKQRNEAYQKQLIDEVIEKIQFRREGSLYFRRQSLLPGDSFLYFPVPYEVFVLCVRAIQSLQQKPHYASMFQTILSALTLLENNFLGNAYPLCRGLIEQHIKNLIIKTHPECEAEFERFRNFEIEQSCCSQSYPDEFQRLFVRKRTQPPTRRNDYLHYGWLDSIKDYPTNDPTGYSFHGILTYLKKSADAEQQKILESIERLHKMCHAYVHGSVIGSKYPLLHYFEISIILATIAKEIFTEVCPEEQHLLNILERDLATLNEQYNSRSTDNFKLYYSPN